MSLLTLLYTPPATTDRIVDVSHAVLEVPGAESTRGEWHRGISGRQIGRRTWGPFPVSSVTARGVDIAVATLEVPSVTWAIVEVAQAFVTVPTYSAPGTMAAIYWAAHYDGLRHVVRWGPMGGVTAADRRIEIAFAELALTDETNLRGIDVSFAEVEVPAADRAIAIGHAVLLIPSEPEQVSIAFAALAVPERATVVDVSFAAIELPDVTNDRAVEVSQASLSVATRTKQHRDGTNRPTGGRRRMR